MKIKPALQAHNTDVYSGLNFCTMAHIKCETWTRCASADFRLLLSSILAEALVKSDRYHGNTMWQHNNTNVNYYRRSLRRRQTHLQSRQIQGHRTTSEPTELDKQALSALHRNLFASFPQFIPNLDENERLINQMYVTGKQSTARWVHCWLNCLLKFNLCNKKTQTRTSPKQRLWWLTRTIFTRQQTQSRYSGVFG